MAAKFADLSNLNVMMLNVLFGTIGRKSGRPAGTPISLAIITHTKRHLVRELV